MSDPSPYQPPLPQGPAVPPLPQDKPAVANVFGIMHLVFATFGVFSAAWGLFIAVAGNPFLKMSGMPEGQNPMQAQLAMQEKLQPVTIINSGFSLVVAVPMIIAGILLLRGRRNAVKWSNGYAVTSLLAKVVNMVLAATIVIPAMKGMTEGIMNDSGAPSQMKDVISGSMVIGAIGGSLVACIYPVLTLILLNRAEVKTWFANQVR